MSKYVNIEWLKAEFNEANEISFYYLNADSRETFEELKKIIEQAPNIDIVHCGKCKRRKYTSDKNKALYCDRYKKWMTADDFCSRGERDSE